jgi:hypothetical protein
LDARHAFLSIQTQSPDEHLTHARDLASVGFNREVVFSRAQICESITTSTADRLTANNLG